MDLIKNGSSRKPIYSREMTLEAHFTFTSPSSSTSTRMVSSESVVKENISTPNSTPLVSMTPRMSSSFKGVGDAWQWSKDGANCSLLCGQHGLQMQYNAASTNIGQKHGTEGEYPQTERETGIPRSSRMNNKSDGQKITPLPHSTECGSKSNRVHVARPYERRCKSTAHIVLQNNAISDEQRPKEFHGSTHAEDLSNQDNKYRHFKDYERSVPNLLHLAPYQPPNYDCRQGHHTSVCSCPHCTTLHNLMASLRYELPCRCPCQHYEVPHKKMVKLAPVSPLSQTFNSHRCYEPPLFARYSKGDSSAATRRLDTPVPSSQSPSPERTPTPRHKQFIKRDSYSTGKKTQLEKENRHKKRSKKGRRPRTIHIDVYCSTSSSSDNDSEISYNSSTSTIEEENSHKKPAARTLVALGSKKNQFKNNFTLQSQSLERVVGFDNKVIHHDTASYESTHVEGKSHAGTFITDHPLSLCSSPSTPMERPVSSPPQVNMDRYSSEETRNNLLTGYSLPCPPKPRTLPISPLISRERKNHWGSEDYSQEHDQRKTDEGFGSHSLGSLGSDDIENASLSQLEADIERLPSAFSSLYTEQEEEKDYRNDDIFIRPWRSPKLERQKYLSELEESSGVSFQDKAIQHPTDYNESDHLKTPTEVVELAKLSVFKDFSEEELEVISKSLTRRESERSAKSRNSGSSLSRTGSFRYPKTSSFTSSRASLHSPSSRDSLSDNKSTKRTISEEARKFLEDLRLENEKSSKSFSQDNSWNSLPGRGKTRLSDSGSLYKNKQVIDDSSVVSTPTSKFANKNEGGTNNVSSYSGSRRQSTGSRLINVGHFKRLDRFPFSTYTYPGPYQSHPTVTLSDDDRRFVRPNIFGDTLKTNRRHGIHFGPPRNPQCSCVSCRVWRINGNQRVGDGTRKDSPPRPRSHSLSEMSHRSSSSTSASASTSSSVKKCS